MTADERFSFSIDDRAQDRAAPRTRSSKARCPTTPPTSTTREPSGRRTLPDHQDELRERCPIAHTERYGGGWLPTRYEDVAAVAYDTERFLARGHHGQLPPARKRSAPVGSPRRSPRTRRSTMAREVCCSRRSRRGHRQAGAGATGVLPRADRRVEGRDVVDAAVEYAQHIPMRVIADMLGLPPRGRRRFREFVEDVLEGVNTAARGADRASRGLFVYLIAQIHDHSPTRATT